VEHQELNPEEIVDEVIEPRDAPPTATVVRFRLLRWLLEKTPGLLERTNYSGERLEQLQTNHKRNEA